MAYTAYATFALDIYDAVLNRIREDTVTGNYGFKSYDLVGDGRFPEVAGMPLVRLTPLPDTIDRLETNTRNHFLQVDVRVFNHVVDVGERDFRDHMKIAGACYDIFSRRDNQDPTLGGRVEEMQVRQIDPKMIRGDQGCTFVSALQMNILAVKRDE